MPSEKTINYVSWTIALLGMIFSLFFSEIMSLKPCSLCWYQRVFLYPLVFLIPIGLIKNDKNIFTYTFVLSLVGLIISGYHVLIYYEFISEGFKLCNAELSCKTKQFEMFGFLSIPLMSFLSFLFISLINFIGVQNVKRS